jgi:hypothetical protein
VELKNRDEEKPKALIVDLDGTLSDLGNRHPFDWKSVGQDAVHQDIVELVALYEDGLDYQVLVASGRMEYARDDTEDWLESVAKVGYVKLFMRDNEDYRPDDIIKKEIYERDIVPYWDVRIVIDDRNRVVKMWRSLGLRVLQVAEGDF